MSAVPRLFIVLYLDEDVDPDLTAPLQHRKYEVFDSCSIGMRQQHDDEQLMFSAERGWALLMHNTKDFTILHDAWMQEGREHHGIIVSKRMEVGRMLRALLNLLDSRPADEMKNQFLYLQNFE